MRSKFCSECKREIPKSDWSCPHCGNPGEPTVDRRLGNEISPKGSMVMLLLFVIFPVLLFVLHLLFPDL